MRTGSQRVEGDGAFHVQTFSFSPLNYATEHPAALSRGATASSRSISRTSAPISAAFAKRSGRVAGVNSQLRVRIGTCSFITGLLEVFFTIFGRGISPRLSKLTR